MKRAIIIRFVSGNDLVNLILKLRIPNEKTAAVKNNRDYRVIEKSEFHALQWAVKNNVNPSRIESIFPLNS